MKQSMLERFWSRVEKTSDCWNWTGAIQSGGYGSVRVGGRIVKAHRFAYELANGPIPPGLHVCHHCDNRRCVNAAHLFLETDKDNRDDCVKKGRHNSPSGARNWRSRNPHTLIGIGNPNAKLSIDAIAEIRALWASRSETQKALASRFGVSLVTINRVCCKRSWRAEDEVLVHIPL